MPNDANAIKELNSIIARYEPPYVVEHCEWTGKSFAEKQAIKRRSTVRAILRGEAKAEPFGTNLNGGF